MSPPVNPELTTLPVEILRDIARYLLVSDLPAVGARGLLIPDSYVEPLRTWRALTPPTLVPGCTPTLCCHSKRGARSGQTVMCFEDDYGPARSSLDLMAVCHSLRQVVQGDALFWAEALLLRPNHVDTALDRALTVNEPKLSFNAHGGTCLHILDFLLNNFGDVYRIDLTLPSTTSADDDSPSRMIREELQKGAPQLQSVDLRFDWAHSHEDALQKAIVILPAVNFCRLMNATFAIVGDALTSLFLAAEDSVFRWRRGDVCKILQACPNLRTVALQMITVDIDTIPPNQIVDFWAGDDVTLPHLSYFLFSDKKTECFYAASHINYPTTARVHADIILPMNRIFNYSLATFQFHCEEATGWSNLVAIGARHNTMALRYKLSVRHTVGWKWPEYISLSFGDDVESAMTFRDPNRQASAGSLTVRNEAMSLTNVESPWLQLMSGGAAVWSTIDSFFRGTADLGIRHVQTFVLDCTIPFACPDHWREILMHMEDVRSIVLPGITSFRSHRILDLAQALSTAYHVIDEDDDELQARAVYPCMRLQSVRLPDAMDLVLQEGVTILRGIMKFRFKDTRVQIDWAV